MDLILSSKNVFFIIVYLLFIYLFILLIYLLFI